MGVGKIICCGDFNAHNTFWGSTCTDENDSCAEGSNPVTVAEALGYQQYRKLFLQHSDTFRSRKNSEITITHLRTGHTGLNKTLQLIGKYPMGLCAHCKKMESVQHVLLECRACVLDRKALIGGAEDSFYSRNPVWKGTVSSLWPTVQSCDKKGFNTAEIFFFYSQYSKCLIHTPVQ